MLGIGRRQFITVFGSAAAAWPLAARAQQPERMRRIGVLMGYAESDAAAQAQIAAMRQELRKLGVGRRTQYPHRCPLSCGGCRQGTRRRHGVDEPQPDVLVSNTNLVTAVVQAEIRTIPIVFIFVGDPVGSGFVSDDARPNGHLTGFANWAARLRLPALYPLAFYAKAGGLISYGFDPINLFQQGAGYVDRILRGAKPADLPVQYPTKLQLAINLKTAKTLGLELPPTLLARADEVIE